MALLGLTACGDEDKDTSVILRGSDTSDMVVWRAIY